MEGEILMKTVKSSNLNPKGEEVESTKAEMSQVREENTRLKMMLRKIESEYKSLKMRVQPENKKGSGNNEVSSDIKDVDQESELISLCLGRINRNESKKEERNSEICKNEELKNGNIGLKLGLANYEDESKFGGAHVVKSSPDNSLISAEDKENKIAGNNNKAAANLKTMRSGEDDVVSQLANVKRARVSVRARCSTPTMNDGCQWRKYGQKIAKSNPYPRAYYRCTVATSCPVRKQVQRCVDDMSILITTYEGTHNHPLPISATAMASATSAAASMLLSGSSTSPQQGLIGTTPSSNLNTDFNGFNINNNMPNVDPSNTCTQPFYVSSSSSPPFPTITLDLSASTSSLASSTSRFPMTGNLGYSQSYSNVQSAIWDSVINPNPVYGSTKPIFSNRTQNIGSFQTGNLFHQPQMQKNHQMSSQQVLTETLTKAITSDPTFRSVIAAAISTMAGGGGQGNAQANDQKVETKGRNLMWDHDQERSPVRISSSASHQAI